MQPVRLEDLLSEYTARRRELDLQGAYFLGDINEEEAERFCKALLIMSIARESDRSRPITVYINSGGGSVGAGLAMMEMMYRSNGISVVVNTVVTSYAYSMGAIILQAGDMRPWEAIHPDAPQRQLDPLRRRREDLRTISSSPSTTRPSFAICLPAARVSTIPNGGNGSSTPAAINS